MLALLRLLEINGASLGDVRDGELVQLVRAINYSNVDREGVEIWLRERIGTYV